MRILVGVFRMVSLLTYSLWVLFVAYTKFQRVDKKEQGRMIKEYNRRILAMAGVKTAYTGSLPKSMLEYGLTEEAPGEIIVSNHISWVDIFSLDSAVASRFVAKAEIANWPIFGKIAQAIGTLFINRSSKRAILQINTDIQEALQRKEVVALFAEGTTTFGNSLLPLKSNFLAPAVKAGAVVQPMVLVYTSEGVPTTRVAFCGDVTLMGSLWNVVATKDVVATAHFLKPIDTKGLDRHQVGKICEERMREELRRVWGERFLEHDPNEANALSKAISHS